MISRYLRDTINLLLYGGTFVGLCAACLTALSFEILGTAQVHLAYILLVGTSTSALYCAHRVVGLKRVAHIRNNDRFEIIRKYKSHIWLYTILWSLISLWIFLTMAEPKLLWILIPGAIIAGGYVLPILPGKKRLRDLGWGKIIMIGWSWGWLTAFIPFVFYGHSSFFMAGIHALERMLFIILITIPFEIRDIEVDHSVALITMPTLLGKRKTMWISILLCIIIFILSLLVSFQYLNPAYLISMTVVSLLTIPLIKLSYRISDDYFFSGLVDGLMILALFIFMITNSIL